MIQIQLTQGQVAMIDDCDRELVSKYKWYAKKDGYCFYAITNSPRKKGKQFTICMHRLILNAKPGQVTDHIDGNGINNIRSNLRLCTQNENLKNRRVSKNTTTGFKGVFWHKKENVFKAQIRNNKKSYFLGNFKNKTEAAKAYNKAALKFHGEFASLNKFPE